MIAHFIDGCFCRRVGIRWHWPTLYATTDRVAELPVLQPLVASANQWHKFSGPKCAINDSACHGWRVAINLLAKLTGWQVAGLSTLIGKAHWQGCLFVFGLHPCPMTREGILSCTHALAPPPRASAIQCSKRHWLGWVGLGWLGWLGWLGAGLVGWFGWVGWAGWAGGRGWLGLVGWIFPEISRKGQRDFPEVFPGMDVIANYPRF